MRINVFRGENFDNSRMQTTFGKQMKLSHRNRIRAVAIAASLLGASVMATQAHAASDDEMTGIHAGDVLVRLRAISIMPNVGTNQSLKALNVGVNNAIVPELDFTYMIRDYLGVELILVPRGIS